MNKLLVGKKVLTENVIINLLGNAFPVVFAVLSIPLIINQIGKEEFGILSIAWLFLGYFSILDLGIGRATTKFVLEYHSKGLNDEIRNLVWTSVILLFTFGLVLGVSLFIFTPSLVDLFFNIPDDLKSLTKKCFYLIAITLPFITGLAAVKGVLEAQQRFRLLNIIKIPSSILNYVIPGVVVFFDNNLFLIVLLLAVTRIALFFLHYYYCFQSLTETQKSKNFVWNYVKDLIRYGGWLTVSNLIGPIMVYFDRFIIGSILTLTLLTYYSTPYEVVTKLLVIAGSATTVLFPIFTNLYINDFKKFYEFYDKSVKALLFVLFLVTFFIACFSFDILGIWLGEDFALKSSVVMKLLCLGVLLNSISAIPFTAIQAINRPDITAKVHMVELPLYLLVLWLLTTHFGIVGVATAWMLRNLVDVVVFVIVYDKLASRPVLSKTIAVLALSMVFFVFCLFVKDSLVFRISTFAISFILFIFVFWFWMLNEDDKSDINRLIFRKI